MTTTERPMATERAKELAGVKVLCLAWNGDNMVPKNTRVGETEEECNDPSAPTLAEFMTVNMVMVVRVQHLFTARAPKGATRPEELGGMPINSPTVHWRALAMFLGTTLRLVREFKPLDS